MLATLLLALSVVIGFALLVGFVFPRISLLECIGGAAPLGLTLSAWAALLLKSTVFLRSVWWCGLVQRQLEMLPSPPPPSSNPDWAQRGSDCGSTS